MPMKNEQKKSPRSKEWGEVYGGLCRKVSKQIIS